MMKIEKQEDITQETHKDGTRFYEKDGNKYPSVTTILNIYPKPEYFWRWKFTNPDADTIFKEAGKYGSEVHKIIESFIKEKDFDYIDLEEKEKKSIFMFMEWFKKLEEENDVEIISCEKMVINHEHKYAGTIDIILKIDNQLWIIDIKTSKGIWNTHKLQLSAYKHAMEEYKGSSHGYGKPNTDNYKLGIIHINHNQDSYEFKEVDDVFDVFLAIKTIWEFEQKDE